MPRAARSAAIDATQAQGKNVRHAACRREARAAAVSRPRATMTPTSTFMLMRHAEEPAGAEGSPSLSPRGWQRAGALVRWLAPLGDSAVPAPLAQPARIVAAATTEAHPSTRPRDTVTPLAQALELDIEQPFDSGGNEARVAAWLHAVSDAVLVCWRHESLPDLARALLPADRASSVPPQWPEDRFDLVWVVHRKGGHWMLKQVPQQRLAGDRTFGVPRRVTSAAA